MAKFQVDLRQVLLHLLCVCLIGELAAKSCNQVDQCKCTFDDGSGTVDLSPIGKQDGTPLINNEFAPDNYAYSFNPCYPFSLGTCVNCAACQYDATNVVYYNIGDSSKVTFSYDGTNVVGTYVSDDGARTSTVSFVCDQSVDPPSYSVDGESAPTQYAFTVTSKYACASGSGPGPTSGPSIHTDVSVSISVGSVLTIIFFSVIVLYLVAGIAFNKLAKHNSGRELVPNVSFWASIPGLIKEGFFFTISLCGRRGGYQRH